MERKCFVVCVILAVFAEHVAADQQLDSHTNLAAVSRDLRAFRARRFAVEDIPAPIEEQPKAAKLQERPALLTNEHENIAYQQQQGQQAAGIGGVLSRVAERLEHLSQSARALQTRLSHGGDEGANLRSSGPLPGQQLQQQQQGPFLSGVHELLGGLMNIGSQAQQAGMSIGAQATQQARDIASQAQMQSKDFNRPRN